MEFPKATEGRGKRLQWGFQGFLLCRSGSSSCPGLWQPSVLNAGESWPFQALMALPPTWGQRHLLPHLSQLRWASPVIHTCLMLKGRVILFIAEQVSPRHQGVAEGCVGQEGAVCHWVQHHPVIAEEAVRRWQATPQETPAGQHLFFVFFDCITGIRDLSSPPGDWTHAPCSRSIQS